MSHYLYVTIVAAMVSRAVEGQKEGDIEYRIGYYIVGRIGRAKDKWVWGQFCPIISANDLSELFIKARRQKIIL